MSMSPRLCAAGIRMRKEIDLLWPKRDKQSDGWLASAAHHAANPNSDHDPDPESKPPGLVRAIDIDEDLGGHDGADPTSANRLCARIVAVAKAGDPRIKYVIFEGRYWSAKTAWKPKTYTGPNAHAKHLHVSFTTAGDLDAGPFQLAPKEKP